MRNRLCAPVVAALGCVAWAQPPQPEPTRFEVATVKPNHTGDRPRTYPRLHNGTFTAEIASLKTLLVVAYGLIELRIVGPQWLDTEKYDISAKAPSGVPDTDVMPLLQALLKDRFRLESHFETKEMSVYDLIVGKGGSKLTPFDPDHQPRTPPNRGQSVMIGVGTTGQIADALARAAGRPVVDRTGIQGRFGWTVSYTPFSAADSANAEAPDLIAAIEQQLGLKLESKREALPVLVIDHAEKIPTEN